MCGSHATEDSVLKAKMSFMFAPTVTILKPNFDVVPILVRCDISDMRPNTKLIACTPQSHTKLILVEPFREVYECPRRRHSLIPLLALRYQVSTLHNLSFTTRYELAFKTILRLALSALLRCAFNELTFTRVPATPYVPPPLDAFFQRPPEPG